MLTPASTAAVNVTFTKAKDPSSPGAGGDGASGEETIKVKIAPIRIRRSRST
jgi:hypothetical protein